MSTVTLGLASRDELNAWAIAAMRGEAQGAHITFASPELLLDTLQGSRWDILKLMIGAGPLPLPEVAQRLGNSVDRVHGDVRALLDVGLLERDQAGNLVFPYDAVHVNFTLRANQWAPG